MSVQCPVRVGHFFVLAGSRVRLRTHAAVRSLQYLAVLLVGCPRRDWGRVVGPSLPALFALACRTASAEVQTAAFVVSQGDAGVETTNAAVVPAPPMVVAEPPPPPAACPSGMVLVEGDYCPDVEQRCLEWMDHGGPYQYFRCKRYAQPAVCKSKGRQHERFCIDETERTEPGSDLPPKT